MSATLLFRFELVIAVAFEVAPKPWPSPIVWATVSGVNYATP